MKREHLQRQFSTANEKGHSGKEHLEKDKDGNEQVGKGLNMKRGQLENCKSREEQFEK